MVVPGARTRLAARAVRAGLLAAGALATAPGAIADGMKSPPPANPAWQEECGSCHVPYPPRLLPAESWRRLMATLDQHFDTDASIAPDRASGIEAFLVANARKSGAEPVLRITETRWFRHEHGEVAAELRSAAVGSPANCGACHTRAEQGRFGEGEIRIPTGEKR